MGDEDEKYGVLDLDVQGGSSPVLNLKFGVYDDDENPSVLVNNPNGVSLQEASQALLNAKKNSLNFSHAVVVLNGVASTSELEAVTDFIYNKLKLTKAFAIPANVVALLSDDKESAIVVDIKTKITVIMPILYGHAISDGVVVAAAGSSSSKEALIAAIVSGLAQSINNLDLNAKGELMDKVFLTGSSVEGIATAIADGVNAKLNTKRVKVINEKSVASWSTGPWQGASILASLSTVHTQFIGKKEFEGNISKLFTKWHIIPADVKQSKKEESIKSTVALDYQVVCPYETLSPNGCSFSGKRSELAKHLESQHPRNQATRQVLPAESSSEQQFDEFEEDELIFEEVTIVKT